MIKKKEDTKEEFLENIKKITDLINKNDNFFFYFSPDPDAVGVSIAFSLFLRQNYKDCVIFLPEGFDPNLDFLFDVASYNKIRIIKDVHKLKDILMQSKPVFVTCDTATHFLLPSFSEINKLKDEFCPKESIELDHHFGGDSEKIYEDSLTLFLKTNSSCEILAEVFDEIGKFENKNIDYIFPRNIVLSLLIGICFDTQFGKFVVDKENYDKWYHFLSDRLKSITWGNPKYLNSSKQVFDAINKMSETKEKVLKYLVDTSRTKKKVGLLILPPVGMYESLGPAGDSTCILSKIVTDLSNSLPEYAGRIGILIFYDNLAKVYFLKIRRSFSYKDYDLRDLEVLLKEIFEKDYLGGGGHSGATSFRINDIDRNDFIYKVEQFFDKVVEIITNLKNASIENNEDSIKKKKKKKSKEDDIKKNKKKKKNKK